MTYRELAEMIAAERREVCENNPRAPWYMININHPAIGPLYKRWRESTGEIFPPSDVDRILWELKLLKPEVLEDIKNAVERKLEEKRYVQDEGL